MNTVVEVLPRALYEYYAKHDIIRKYAFDEMADRGIIKIEPEKKAEATR